MIKLLYVGKIIRYIYLIFYAIGLPPFLPEIGKGHEKIETIERSRIVFGKIYIPVSEQYKDQFQNYLDKNFLV